MYYLGLCHLEGFYLEKDKKKALEFIEKAANLGNRNASSHLKELQSSKNNPPILNSKK